MGNGHCAERCTKTVFDKELCAMEGTIGSCGAERAILKPHWGDAVLMGLWYNSYLIGRNYHEEDGGIGSGVFTEGVEDFG